MKKKFISILLGLCALGFALPGYAICTEGEKAAVLWKGKWYPATVLKVNENQTRCFIRYDGYGREWDEWVGSNRIQFEVNVGDEVLVKSEGEWYPASILKIRRGKFLVHYDDYTNEDNEWVSKERIRRR